MFFPRLQFINLTFSGFGLVSRFHFSSPNLDFISSSPKNLQIMNINGIFLIIPLESYIVFVRLIFKYSSQDHRRVWDDLSITILLKKMIQSQNEL